MSVVVTWGLPEETRGIDKFYAYTDADPLRYCEAGVTEDACTIGELKVCSQLNIYVRACHTKPGEGTKTSIFNVNDKYSDSNVTEENLSELFCSKPIHTGGHTLPSGHQFR